jgi:hypothetical protein
VAGAGSGLLEAVMNAATLDWELATGRAVMNVMHAGFSGGAVLGVLGAGALLALGWGYGQVLGPLALLCGLVLTSTLLVGYTPAQPGSPGSAGPGVPLHQLFRRRGLAVLGLVCLLGIAVESVANNWLVLYLGELDAAVARLGGRVP